MTTRRRSKSAPVCCAEAHSCVRTKRGAITIGDVVDDYVRYHAPVVRAQLTFYAGIAHSEAVARASRAERPDGKRHDHQRRINRRAMRRLAELLGNETFRRERHFGDIYQRISALTRHVKGIGPLLVYDTALRIGANRRKLPTLVYVHAGVAKGARAVARQHVPLALSPTAFPSPLSGLPACELEDLLCIFGRVLQRKRLNK